MTRIVSVGECMVELSPLGTDDIYRLGFAGDTFNTAWYLRRLLPPVWSVDYLTAIGTDATSDRMFAFFRSQGIGTGHVVRREDSTVGLYVIALEDGERSFSYWRGQSAARRLADDPAALDRAFASARLVYVSGITVAILPPAGRAALLDALARYRRGGGTVAFDPNLRPRLWSDDAEMTRTIAEAAREADIVLPSHEDEARWFSDADPEATARRYAAGGAGTVVVKNGAGTITLLHGGALSAHSAVAVPRVVDTTAAGDSFNAGFLAALLGGAAPADAVAAGAAVAARVVAATGALIPLAEPPAAPGTAASRA